MPKGLFILGALTICMRKGFSFDWWVGCFGRDMTFCRCAMEICWTIYVILRDEPQQSRRKFSFWGHWLFIWENDLVLKLELTVLGEIWPFEGDLCSCAEPYGLFCQLHLELWECHFCFVKWAKAMEKNCNEIYLSFVLM